MFDMNNSQTIPFEVHEELKDTDTKAEIKFAQRAVADELMERLHDAVRER